MKLLIEALDRWSEGKPTGVIWILAAAACWVVLAALVALLLVVPGSVGAPDIALLDLI